MELTALLTKLKMDYLEAQLETVCEQAAKRELATASFVARGSNAIILGPPGVGKTHLAIALGVKAIEAGYSALFLSLEALMTRLQKAQRENRLDRPL